MEWDSIRSELVRITSSPSSVRLIAKEIPAHYVTVYRWISGETSRPTLLAQERIKEVIDNHKDSKELDK